MGSRKPSSGSGSDRSYMTDVDKVIAHPTRRKILKALEKEPHTTVELEQATERDRYNLYHHLSVLEETGLVRSRVVGKAKEYSLRSRKRPDAAYLQLRRDDPEEQEQLEVLLEAVREITKDRIPNLEKVVKARLVLSYPWSPED